MAGLPAALAPPAPPPSPTSPLQLQHQDNQGGDHSPLSPTPASAAASLLPSFECWMLQLKCLRRVLLLGFPHEAKKPATSTSQVCGCVHACRQSTAHGLAVMATRHDAMMRPSTLSSCTRCTGRPVGIKPPDVAGAQRPACPPTPSPPQVLACLPPMVQVLQQLLAAKEASHAQGAAPPQVRWCVVWCKGAVMGAVAACTGRPASGGAALLPQGKVLRGP